jgi:hypothetical protein
MSAAAPSAASDGRRVPTKADSTYLV